METWLHAPHTTARSWAAVPLILCVEDNTMMLDLMARELARVGYHVLTAGDGAEALEHFLREGAAIDLIIADFRLPDMTAGDLFEQMKASGPAPEILVCTGLLLPQTVAALADAGIVHRLDKPFRFHELMETVAALVPP